MELIIRQTKAANQGIAGEEAMHDIFIMRSLGDETRPGDDLFQVEVITHGDDGIECLRVKSLTEFDAELVPGIFGAIDLGYRLYSYLVLLLSDQECEFFADLFVDERGRDCELHMIFQA